MAVGKLGAHDGFVAEFGAQASQRAIGGIEIARGLFGEKTQLLAGSGASFGAEFDFDYTGGKLKRLQAQPN